MHLQRRAVFLDRDGVLNRVIMRNGKPFPPGAPAEVEILPGAPEACRRLAHAGYILVLVTNQPDIARGTTTRNWVNFVNERVKNELKLDLVMVCPHDESDRCACRKPAPGMLLAAASQLELDLGGSFMIGDRWKDIEAGRNAGCKTIWIRSEYAERSGAGADYSATGLLDATEWILG